MRGQGNGWRVGERAKKLGAKRFSRGRLLFGAGSNLGSLFGRLLREEMFPDSGCCEAAKRTRYCNTGGGWFGIRGEAGIPERAEARTTYSDSGAGCCEAAKRTPNYVLRGGGVKLFGGAGILERAAAKRIPNYERRDGMMGGSGDLGGWRSAAGSEARAPVRDACMASVVPGELGGVHEGPVEVGHGVAAGVAAFGGGEEGGEVI